MGQSMLLGARRMLARRFLWIVAILTILFVAGVRWSHLAIIGSVVLIAILAVLWWFPAAGVNVLKPYQAARLTGFTHPDSDPRGARVA